MIRKQKCARAALGWTALAFLCTQVGLNLALDYWRPEANDPEFEIRLALLNRRQAEDPQRPLLLVVGSSRLVSGFRPEILPPLTLGSGKPPLVFNFSHYGGGPLINLVELHRLFRHGVRPRWLVLEVTPPLLAQEGTSLVTTIMAPRDLPTLHPYLSSGKLYARFLRARVLPCCQYRSELTELFLSALAASAPLPAQFCLDELGGHRDTRFEGANAAALVAFLTGITRQQYRDRLAGYRIAPEADHALRETIELAQAHGARVALFVTPESGTFRGWYAAGAQASLTAYYDELMQTYGVRIVDAQEWLPDSDFLDGHHVFGSAAERLTRRLAVEVLQPLIDGTAPQRGNAPNEVDFFSPLWPPSLPLMSQGAQSAPFAQP